MMWRWCSKLALPLCFDNGAFSFWQSALKNGQEWAADRDWNPYYKWLEPRLQEGRWAVIPDSPGAPSQINDGLLNDWPFGQWGAPLWHMDNPIDRLLRLCDKYERVCLGWTGQGKDSIVGCEAWFRRMDEVASALGNQWPNIHMMRGVMVAREFPFHSADSTSLAQNGHLYDHKLWPIPDRYAGRIAYADKLERGIWTGKILRDLQRSRSAARGESQGNIIRQTEQLGFW